MKLDLIEASLEHVPTLVGLMQCMGDELQEVPFDAGAARDSIRQALLEQVHWFLFQDEAGNPAGACYLQSVHNYWRRGRRFYLGGFYLAPTYRGGGNLRRLYADLKTWAVAHDGVQIYGHIHKDNARSLGAFGALGLKVDERLLCVDHWGD